MKTLSATAVLILLSIAATRAVVADDDSHQRWWHENWRDPYWARPCEVKLDSKPGEFKREVKCKDGVGARWRGEWKEEFWDGPCRVKIETSREEFKEEVKCKRRD